MSEHGTPQRRRWAKIVSRDTLSYLGGWYLMIWQAQFAQEFNWMVFVGGMVASGIPGAVQAVALITGRTATLPPAPPPSPSSPEPSPSSSGA